MFLNVTPFVLPALGRVCRGLKAGWDMRFLLHSRVADVRSGRSPCASRLQALKTSLGERFRDGLPSFKLKY